MPRSEPPMDREQWALYLARLHITEGPGVADVVRRFVAGDIAYRPIEQPDDWDEALTPAT